MNFLKTFLASFFGALIALLVSCFVMSIVFFAILKVKSSTSPTKLKKGTVLRISLHNPITDNMEEEDMFSKIPGFEHTSKMSLLKLNRNLERAAEDDRIEGIYLYDLYPFRGGFAQAREIRQSLEKFKESKKWIIAYGEWYSEAAYYVASVADFVFIHPEGSLEFNGLAYEPIFFKRLFDKLEIKPRIFRVGDYKSIAEPFVRDKLSEANRRQFVEVMNDLLTEEINAVAQSRSIPVDEVKRINTEMLVTNAQEAKDYRLVDSVIHYDQVLDYVRQQLNLEEEEKIPYVNYGSYYPKEKKSKSSDNEIAVLIGEGSIQAGGEGDDDVIESFAFSKELRKLRKNEDVKAVVLRVNSPGGQALAADVIWREVSLTAQAKPVVASMSDQAASGGYYIAMASDVIVAHPTTITGSIGVISVLFDMSKFLENKLGITHDELKTGEVGRLFTFNRPLTDREQSIWQKRTDEIYESFTAKAAQGRNKSQDEIKEVAQGRIWTGKRAMEIGLVDTLGGFEDAIKIAARRANLGDDYYVKFYPLQQSFFEKWASRLDGSTSLWQDDNLSFAEKRMLNKVRNKIKEWNGTQMRLLYDIDYQE